MFKIFINYSRSNSAPAAFRLCEYLRNELPGAVIWIDNLIPPGVDFREELTRQVRSCDYFLAIIDHRWLSEVNRRRRVNADNYQELEIRWALESKRNIIPILVDDASMPSQRRLPLSLKALASRHAIKILSEDFDVTAKHLIERIFQSESDVKLLRVVDHWFVRRKGWSFIDLADRLMHLDFEIIEGLTEADEASPTELGPIFEEFTQTWRLLIDRRDEIVGYWRFVPLKREKYERARSGEMFDDELNRAAMRNFTLPDTYDVYIAAMEVVSRYRAPCDRLLFFSFLDVLDELTKDDIYLGRVCANGLSQSGDRLCRGLGMRDLGTRKESGTIFESEMVTIMKHIVERSTIYERRYKNLLLRYQVKFPERSEVPM